MDDVSVRCDKWDFEHECSAKGWMTMELQAYRNLIFFVKYLVFIASTIVAKILGPPRAIVIKLQYIR